MSKTDSRERAVLLLFESDSNEQLLNSYSEFEEKVNMLISENSKGWAAQRLPAMDRAVLRMAITELVRSAQTPVGTVISESLLLCEKYSTPESPRFINGVLGTIAHKVRGVELLQGKNSIMNQDS